MKYTEILKLQKDELDKRLYDLKIELMKLNAQVAIGTTPKSTKQIREIKRNIARFETLRMAQFHKELDKMKTVSETSGKKKKYTQL
jgi:ribosomal protein L29